MLKSVINELLFNTGIDFIAVRFIRGFRARDGQSQTSSETHLRMLDSVWTSCD